MTEQSPELLRLAKVLVARGNATQISPTSVVGAPSGPKRLTGGVATHGRYVRTPQGADRYGVPIGSLITTDGPEQSPALISSGKPRRQVPPLAENFLTPDQRKQLIDRLVDLYRQFYKKRKKAPSLTTGRPAGGASLPSIVQTRIPPGMKKFSPKN